MLHLLLHVYVCAVCVPKFVGALVSEGMCEYACGGQRLVGDIFLSCFPFCMQRQGLSGPQLVQLASLLQELSCLCLGAEVTGSHYPRLVSICECAGDPNSSSPTCAQALHPLSHLPSPKYHTLMIHLRESKGPMETGKYNLGLRAGPWIFLGLSLNYHKPHVGVTPVGVQP